VYIDVYFPTCIVVPISDYLYLSIYLHTCEHFVGVALVCNIPHDFVLRAVEDVVQGHCEFRYTQWSGQMPARSWNLSACGLGGGRLLLLWIPSPVCVEGEGAGGGQARKTRKERESEKDRRAERGEPERERKKARGGEGVGRGRERKIHPNTSR